MPLGRLQQTLQNNWPVIDDSGKQLDLAGTTVVSAVEISLELQMQCVVIRKLKTDKASKELIDEASKVFKDMKANFKKLTVSSWKLAKSTPMLSAFDILLTGDANFIDNEIMIDTEMIDGTQDILQPGQGSPAIVQSDQGSHAVNDEPS